MPDHLAFQLLDECRYASLFDTYADYVVIKEDIPATYCKTHSFMWMIILDKRPFCLLSFLIRNAKARPKTLILSEKTIQNCHIKRTESTKLSGL